MANLGILVPSSLVNNTLGGTVMGKYFLAWILGVPAVVLVLIYLFFH
jgi:hypothetical protein